MFGLTFVFPPVLILIYEFAVGWSPTKVTATVDDKPTQVVAQMSHDHRFVRLTYDKSTYTVDTQYQELIDPGDGVSALGWFFPSRSLPIGAEGSSAGSDESDAVPPVHAEPGHINFVDSDGHRVDVTY